jgi:hypothetical protein
MMLNALEQSECLLQLARRAIQGQRGATIDRLDETVPMAKANGIHFYVLSLLAAEPGRNAEGHPVEKEYARLAGRQRYVERETARLSRFFAERDLPVFFMKDFMRYPFTDHDVDFVIARPTLASVYRASMGDAGYQYRFGKSQFREPDKYFYYPRHADEGFRDIRFHLHKALSWNGVVFLDSEAVLSRCKEENVGGGSFLIPSCEDEILIMAAHALFENASIRIGEILEFGLLVRDEPIHWQRLIESATRYNWQVALAFFLEWVWRALPDTPSEGSTQDIREWVRKTLSDAGVTDGFPSGNVVFPYEIPFASCMRVYLDKLRRDVRMGGLGGKALFWEGLSFFVSVWFSRLKRWMNR